MDEGQVKLPERDEDRRRVFEAMLHITRKQGNKFTAEELENICLRRGYLKVEPTQKGEKK